MWLERARELPDKPGVYLMKAGEGEIIYVGKAKNLRNRVPSYFQEGTSDHRAFIHLLGDILTDLETVVTRSEKEALLLERELIRRHEPRFNVVWKDDKQYLSLRVDPKHEYPWVQVVRRTSKDGARYFGPFHSASATRQTLRVVNRYFQLRTCRDSVLYNRNRPCLEYQIGRCPAPCVFEIDKDAYHQDVSDVLMFLEGKGDELLDQLEHRMAEAAERMEFEQAARFRDQMMAVQRTLEKQQVAFESGANQDALGLYREGETVCLTLVEVRDGRVQNVSSHLYERVAGSDGELLESYLQQRYAPVGLALPDEVLLPTAVEGREFLQEILTEQRGKKVEIKAPKRGDRRALLQLAAQNAQHGFREKRKSTGAIERTLKELQQKLRLRNLPAKMECFDISNLGTSNVVGAKVAFSMGEPDRKRYRRYRVKSVSGQDDFGSMYEVILRRLERGLKEDDLPDLLVIDGGKGQLNAARAAMKDLEIEGVDLISLAKSRAQAGPEGDEGPAQRSPERVFLPNAKDPIVLPQNGAPLLLLARLRDETHRYVITFHREQRKKSKMRSTLEDIPGIGPTRRKQLLKHLGSLKGVREATIEELAKVPGLGQKAAEVVWGALHPGSSKPSKSS